MSEAVRAMFDALARRYDLGNDLLSLGLHRRWKRAAARLALERGTASPNPVGAELASARIPPRILDSACGTGDVCLAITRLAQAHDIPVQLTGLDFSAEMLGIARRRCAGVADPRGGRPQRLPIITFIEGDALALSFPDAHFDAATIAFGLRNLDDLARGLAELARVVRPGGRVVVLETGQPANALWRGIYRIYGKLLLEPLGALATGQRAAYAYLNRTAASFPCGERLLEIARNVSVNDRPAFSKLHARSLLGGIAWLYLLERQPAD